jgi:hypothetical protein
MVNLNSGSLSVLLGVGDGTFQAGVNYALGRGLHNIATGDFNSDGKPDLAVPVYYFDDVWVFLNTCVSDNVSLSVEHTNSTITVSWPFPSVGFVLESTANLNSTNWQPAVEMPITNNSRLQVTLSLTPQRRYFRLRKS